MRHLSQWKNIAPMATYGTIVDPPIDAELNNEQISYLDFF